MHRLVHAGRIVLLFVLTAKPVESTTDGDPESSPSSPSKRTEARKQQQRACKQQLIAFCQQALQEELLGHIAQL